MVMISPQIAMTKPAPAESRTSRTGIVKPVGAQAAPAPGPAGWNAAVLELLAQRCREPAGPREGAGARAS